jgi:hypothetical protein
MQEFHVQVLSANNWETATFRVLDGPASLTDEMNTSRTHLNDPEADIFIYWFPNAPADKKNWENLAEDVVRQRLNVEK